MSIYSDLKKTINYCSRNGVVDTFYAARERLMEHLAAPYCYKAPEPDEIRLQRARWERIAAKEAADSVFRSSFATLEIPLISILVPAYETNETFLRALIDSVLDQTFGNYELIIADASVSDGVRNVCRTYQDERIHYHKLSGNGGISANTNAAAMYAQGSYVAFLDHDDLLTVDAIFEMTYAILKTNAEIVYSDEDKTDASGRQFMEPNRKPDFNLDYLLTNNYICHFTAMKRGLFLALRMRAEYDGAQDYDLLLRAPKSNITHVARVLYHWRCHEASTAGNPGSKDYANEAGRRALESYFKDSGIRAEVVPSRHRGFYEVNYIPGMFEQRKDVGVIGGKVINHHDTICSGMIEPDGTVTFAGMHERESGPAHRADTVQDAFAVDVRCMIVREELKGIYAEVFGMSYEEHVMKESDQELMDKSILFCKKVHAMGYLVVWNPRMVKRIQ